MNKKNPTSKGPGSGLEDVKKITKENIKKEAPFPGGKENAAGAKEEKNKKNNKYKK